MNCTLAAPQLHQLHHDEGKNWVNWDKMGSIALREIKVLTK
jgi:hypothetical protein